MAAEYKTAIIFSRCSSSGSLEGRQDTTRQVEDLQDYVSRNYFKVEKVFQEHISGATKLEHREVLASAISYAKEHHIHTILTTELSRLGRSDDVLYVVKECKDAGINIFQEDGTPSPILNILISCLIISSQSELTAIKSRLQSGKEKYIRDGGRLGKPKGAGIKTKDQMASEYRSVIKNLKAGQSIRTTLGHTFRRDFHCHHHPIQIKLKKSWSPPLYLGSDLLLFKYLDLFVELEGVKTISCNMVRYRGYKDWI